MKPERRNTVGRPDETDRRLEDFRAGLRARHAGIEPDAGFAARVVLNLPRDGSWPIIWAARRILPAAVALALALLAVTLMRAPRGSGDTTAVATAAVAESPGGLDPVSWLLGIAGEAR
jgi:hypothetical protein